MNTLVEEGGKDLNKLLIKKETQETNKNMDRIQSY